MLGYRDKIGAWLLVQFLILLTPMMHKYWGISNPMVGQTQMIKFMKNLFMLGGALLIRSSEPNR